MKEFRDFGEFEAAVHQTLPRGVPVVGALARYAIIRYEGKYLLLTGCWEFSMHEKQPKSAEDYAELLLLEEWIPYERVPQAFNQLLGQQGGFRPLGYSVDNRVELKAASWEERISKKVFHGYDYPGTGSYSGWPELFCAFTTDPTSENIGVSHYPLIRRGMKPLGNLKKAASDWVWWPWRRMDVSERVAYQGRFGIVWPSFIARIKTARWSGNCVDVELDLAAAGAGLELQWIASDGEKEWPGHAPVEQRFRIEGLPADTRSIQLFLVGESDRVLSHARLVEGDEGFDADKQILLEERRVAIELSAGENRSVEFKPFVFPKKMDPERGQEDKLAEITRVIASFANQQAGRLYVGVNKEGRPQGLDALRRCTSGDQGEPLRVMEERITNRIHDDIFPNPELEVRSILISESPVLIFDCSTVKKDKYKHGPDRTIYIRKGSTTRRWDEANDSDPFGYSFG